MIFPSMRGRLPDPRDLSRLWRGVREDLGVPEVSMTQDRYMSRGRVLL